MALIATTLFFFLLHIIQDRLLVLFRHWLAGPRKDFTAVVGDATARNMKLKASVNIETPSRAAARG